MAVIKPTNIRWILPEIAVINGDVELCRTKRVTDFVESLLRLVVSLCAMCACSKISHPNCACPHGKQHVTTGNDTGCNTVRAERGCGRGWNFGRGRTLEDRLQFHSDSTGQLFHVAVKMRQVCLRPSGHVSNVASR